MEAWATPHGKQSEPRYAATTDALAAAAPVSNQDAALEEEGFLQPTEHDLAEYAAWLGANTEKEPELLWIVKEGLQAPLPEFWKPCHKGETDDIYYLNTSTGDICWDHPCDLHYKQLYQEHKQALYDRRRKERAEHQAATRIQNGIRCGLAVQLVQRLKASHKVATFNLQLNHPIRPLNGVVNMSGLTLDENAVCSLCNFIRSEDASRVVSLHLKSCQLNAESLHLITEAIIKGQLTRLKCLDLRMNAAIGKDGSIMIGSAVKELKALAELGISTAMIKLNEPDIDLSASFQDIEGVAQLAGLFESGCLPNITSVRTRGGTLDLSVVRGAPSFKFSGQLSGRDACLVVGLLANVQTALENLDLSRCELGPPDVTVLSETLSKSKIRIEKADLETFYSAHSDTGRQFMNKWLAGYDNEELVAACERMYGAAPLHSLHNGLQALTSLDLSHNNLSPRGAGELAVALRGRVLRHIRVLRLANTQLCGKYKVARAWEGSYDKSGFAALITAMHNSELREIDISANCIRVEGAAALAEAIRVGEIGLTSLDISSNRLREDGVKKILAACSSLPALTSISIGDNWLKKEDGLSIASLVGDGICFSDLTHENIRRFLAGRDLKKMLQFFDDDTKGLSVEEVLDGFQGETQQEIGRQLYVAYGEKPHTQLSSSGIVNLEYLNLASSNIGRQPDDWETAVAKQTGQRVYRPKGTERWLIHHPGIEAIKTLAKGVAASRLKCLNVSDNQLAGRSVEWQTSSLEGFAELLSALPPTLTELNLSNNLLQADGARAMATTRPSSITQLSFLDLSANNFGGRLFQKSSIDWEYRSTPEGTKAVLLLVNEMKDLRMLNVLFNNLDKDSAATFVEMRKQLQLLTSICGFDGQETAVSLWRRGAKLGDVMLFSDEISDGLLPGLTSIDIQLLADDDEQENRQLTRQHLWRMLERHRKLEVLKLGILEIPVSLLRSESAEAALGAIKALRKIADGVIEGGLLASLRDEIERRAFLALTNRPPNPFSAKDFILLKSHWARDGRDNKLFDALLQMISEWALNPITKDSWEYLKTFVLPLPIWTEMNFDLLKQHINKNRNDILAKFTARLVAWESEDGGRQLFHLKGIKTDSVVVSPIPSAVISALAVGRSEDFQERLDVEIFPQLLVGWANEAYDGFKATLLDAITGSVLEEHMHGQGPANDEEVCLRLRRDKCIKTVDRIRRKVLQYRQAEGWAHSLSSFCEPDFAASSLIPDVLRASITCKSVAAVVRVWRQLQSRLRVIRMQNNFEGDRGYSMDDQNTSHLFPHIVVNTMFQVGEQTNVQVSAEIQIHLHEVLQQKKQDIKLQQIARGTSAQQLNSLFPEWQYS